jgi:hypothetical protein
MRVLTVLPPLLETYRIKHQKSNPSSPASVRNRQRGGHCINVLPSVSPMFLFFPCCIFYRRDTPLLERLQEGLDVLFFYSFHERTLFWQEGGKELWNFES